MAHHSGQEFPNLASLGLLGPTGKFPQGKLNETDEGEIMMGVAADPAKKKVILNFGKPTAWVGLDPSQAIELADSIRDAAFACMGITT